MHDQGRAWAAGPKTTMAETHRAQMMPEARIGRLFARPKVLAVLCVLVLAGAGWIYLGLMVASHLRVGPAAALGPGMGVLDLVAWPAGTERALLEALCRPTLGIGTAIASASDLTLVLLMWCAMALAMMLPTAGPMILTYA